MYNRAIPTTPQSASQPAPLTRGAKISFVNNLKSLLIYNKGLSVKKLSYLGRLLKIFIKLNKLLPYTARKVKRAEDENGVFTRC